MKRLKILGLVLAASLSFAAAEAYPGWTLEGCWSPYPNCVGGSDIYIDSSGNHWDCGRCYTNKNPGPSTCRITSTAHHRIGYWCS